MLPSSFQNTFLTLREKGNNVKKKNVKRPQGNADYTEGLKHLCAAINIDAPVVQVAARYCSKLSFEASVVRCKKMYCN